MRGLQEVTEAAPVREYTKETDHMVEVARVCYCCGKEHTIMVSEKVYDKYQTYLMGHGYIQDIPLPAWKREFLKTGMCRECQTMIFGGGDDE